VTALKKLIFLTLALGLVGGTIAVVASRRGRNTERATLSRPASENASLSGLEGAPPEVQEFLARVLEKIPSGGAHVTGYQFDHWECAGKPTREAFALKAVPGTDPDKLIARVMDIDGYVGRIAHVDVSRSEPDPAFERPQKVRFYQVISVPGVVKIQQESALVDAGTVNGYRIAYWYLLEDKTAALDPKVYPRSAFNVGAWLAAPGVVGYALSSWPRREDVNALQWLAVTSGADLAAKKIAADNIDRMAAWAKGH
jgi:hypothetical protein